jgi:hypothetical protein
METAARDRQGMLAARDRQGMLAARDRQGMHCHLIETISGQFICVFSFHAAFIFLDPFFDDRLVVFAAFDGLHQLAEHAQKTVQLDRL